MPGQKLTKIEFFIEYASDNLGLTGDADETLVYYKGQSAIVFEVIGTQLDVYYNWNIVTPEFLSEELKKFLTNAT
jgi:hypothetical protein